jgi:hypothetical protein
MLPLFHGAVGLAKAPPQASARWLKRKVSLAIEQDRELVIDPQFFLDFAASNPRICDVQILLKRGRAHNEMTRYRYDVVLHVGETAAASWRPDAEWQVGDLSAADLVSRFETRPLSSARILNVPNRRLASDLAAVRRLWSADDRQSVGEIRQSTAAEADAGIDPEDFWKLADTTALDVQIGCSPHSADGRFDVALAVRDRARGAPLLQSATNVLPSSRGGRLATDPLAVAFMQHLGQELGQLLSDRLPEARLPVAVLAVNVLPSDAAATSAGDAAYFRPQSNGHADARDMAQG